MYKLNRDFEIMELENELIAQNNVNGEIHMINGTASIILNSLINNRMFIEIVNMIQDKFPDANEKELVDDIEETKNILIQKNIIIIE